MKTDRQAHGIRLKSSQNIFKLYLVVIIEARVYFNTLRVLRLTAVNNFYSAFSHRVSVSVPAYYLPFHYQLYRLILLAQCYWTQLQMRNNCQSKWALRVGALYKRVVTSPEQMKYRRILRHLLTFNFSVNYLLSNLTRLRERKGLLIWVFSYAKCITGKYFDFYKAFNTLQPLGSSRRSLCMTGYH